MDLGIQKVVDEGNGNTIIYTALIAAGLANMIPTPFDAIYFRRVNKLERDFDEGLVSSKALETHVALEYYLWTALWYGALFTGVYAFGGKYRNNARLLIGVVAGGLVVGAVSKNIQANEEARRKKEAQKSNQGI
jgi:hypothetical protein